VENVNLIDETAGYRDVVGTVHNGGILCSIWRNAELSLGRWCTKGMLFYKATYLRWAAVR
jgi:hypothetical protein